jgi:tetratricopeptide (TPR) repeat protein
VAARLAHHFERAGLYERAAAYRLRAGNRAWRLSASKEALDHAIRGLELLALLTPTPGQIRLEMDLQTLLATGLVVTEGYASGHVQEAYARARDLSRQLGNPPAALPALYGLSAFRFARAELEQAMEEGQQVLELAEEAEAGAYLFGARLVLGAASVHLGKYPLARQHLEAAAQGYDPGQYPDFAYELGHDPAVASLSYLSFALWVEGYPDQALAAKDRALALANKLNHPYTRGYAASFAAMLLQKIGDWPGCQRQAEAALQIGRQGRFPLWEAIGGITRGYARVRQGQVDAGIAEMVEGHMLWHGSGAQLAQPYQHIFLADAYLRAGRIAEARQAVEESFCSDQDVWWLAEQYRMRAELIVREGGAMSDAESALNQALAVSREQGARSLELRATMSLARLHRDQGRTAGAQAHLRQIYASFGEGFATPDLQQAQQLLAQPAHARQAAGN